MLEFTPSRAGSLNYSQTSGTRAILSSLSSGAFTASPLWCSRKHPLLSTFDKVVGCFVLFFVVVPWSLFPNMLLKRKEH